MENPISESMIRDIRNGLYTLSELEKKIEKAVACGIDCQEVIERCQLQKDRLMKVDQVYGAEYPTRSPRR